MDLADYPVRVQFNMTMVDRDMERNGQNISWIVFSVSGLSLDTWT
jgi:hypothetical protein